MKKLLAFLVLLPLCGWTGTVTESEVTKMIGDLQEGFAGAISTGVLGPPKTMGRGHFSLGLLVAGCPIKYIDPDTDKEKSVPFAMPSIYARLGVSKSFDIGIKYAYVPKEEPIKSGSYYGAEARKGILKETIVKPDISLSLTYNKFKIDVEENGKYSMDWDVSNYGAKLLVSKKLPLLNPYAGIGFDKYSSKIDYSISDKNINNGIKKNGNPLRMLAGCELNLLLVKISAELNRFGDTNIYAMSGRIGF